MAVNSSYLGTEGHLLKDTENEGDRKGNKEQEPIKHKPPQSLDRRGSQHVLTEALTHKKGEGSLINTPRSTPASYRKRASGSIIRRNSSNTSFISTGTSGDSVTDELLDRSFTDWLEKKERERKSLRQRIKEENVRKEEDKASKKAVMNEKSAKAVEKWRLAKEIAIKKHKEEQEIIKRKEDEKKQDVIEKEQNSAEMAEKWRQSKLSVLREKRREEKQKLLEAEREKQAEERELLESAAEAFKSWKHGKDQKLRDSVIKKIKESKEQAQKTILQMQERQIQSHNAYKQWKVTKTKKLKETKTLFTYNPNPREPPRNNKWRPARSVQYSYPTDPAIKQRNDKLAIESTQTLQDSYSSSSFEEEEREEEREEGREVYSEHDSTDGIGNKDDDDSLRKTGQLKTVAVCCQTLEYWCTCKQRNIEE